MTAPDQLQPCRRHDWRPDDPDQPTGYACADCAATAHSCTTCRRPVPRIAARTCDRCISDARNCVRDIRDLYHRLPDVVAAIGGLHAIRYDRGGAGKTTRRPTDTTIIGGDALVMSAPGHVNQPHPLPDDLDPHERAIDVALRAAEHHDPPSVLAVLTGWEDQWRAEQHQPAAERTSVAAAAEYLVVHAAWAAQHSDSWGDFVEETRALRWRLRILTGDDRRPVKAAVPCPYCAGTIVQRWRDVDPERPGSGGLEDVRRCTVCGLTWPTEAHFRMAMREAHQALPRTHPDALVTIEDAKRIYRPRGVRPNLLDLWVHRGVLQPATDGEGRPRRDERGALLYRLGDIDARLGTTRTEETA